MRRAEEYLAKADHWDVRARAATDPRVRVAYDAIAAAYRMLARTLMGTSSDANAD